MADNNTNPNNDNGKLKLTPEQVTKLFESADKAEQVFAKALEAAEKKKAAVGLAFREIYEKVGTGPFEYGDSVFMVTKRDNKDKDGNLVSTAYFKKGRKEFTVTKIGK